MNFYVSVINDIIEQLECSIGENLQLADISSKAGISDFHFNRMFKTVTGVTLKQYILGRKLTNAMDMLRNTNKTVINIALDMGFEYPEVFSRAFKKQFGISPTHFRDSQVQIDGIKKASIVERDIINYRGTLALKGNVVFVETLELIGIHMKVNTNSKNFEKLLSSETSSFLQQSADDIRFKQDKFYTIVGCEGNDSGVYNVFCGRPPEIDAEGLHMDGFTIPSGWYVNFLYAGDMFDIKEVFIDDLYKWIMIKEAEINPNGIGMLNIYDSNYAVNHNVNILVPLKKPV